MKIRCLARCLAAVAGAAIASSALATNYSVSATTTDDCTHTGMVTVHLVLSATGGASAAAGGQFFLSNSAGLTFVSATAGSGLQVVYTNSTATTADVAIGVMSAMQVIGDGATVANIVYSYSGTICNTAALVTFRDNSPNPSTTLTDNQAQAIAVSTSDLGSITLGDTTAPMFTSTPADITIDCNVLPTLINTGGSATATDNCDTPAVTFTDSAPTTVSPTTLNGWSFIATDEDNIIGGDGSTGFALGPATPPLGSGSAHLNSGSDGGQSAQMSTDAWFGTPLNALTALSYSTYLTRWDANFQQDTYLTLYIDTTGSGANYNDRLFFEPDYSSAGAGNPNPFTPQGPPALNVWQTWDCLHGMWWSQNDNNPGSDAYTLGTYLAAHPNSRIVGGVSGRGGIRIAAGFTGLGDFFDVYVDNFRIATGSASAVYDFEAAPGFPCADNVITRTWKATDRCGNASTSTQVITQHDMTAPSISCPPDVTVNADAGGCSALLFNNSFDAPLSLSNSPAPGVWYVDRFPPAGFQSASFLGGNRLKASISSADSISNRPNPYQSNFYNTQGRDLNIDIPAGGTLGIDLYIDPTWLTGPVRRADMWAVGTDNSNSVVDYAIIGFSSSNPSGDATGAENTDPTSGVGTPRWRIYDNSGSAWIVVGPAPTAGWHRLEIQLLASTKVYKLDGVAVGSLSNDGTVQFSSVLIQAYNFGKLSPPVNGDSYDVYWDNLFTGPVQPVASDNCSTPTVSYVRSDNAALTFSDPFPQGTTTVTWTATDCSGLFSTCDQLITVNAFNTLNATVTLDGVSAGPFTRGIDFVLYTATGCSGPTFSPLCQNVVFSGGTGTATFDVPCGDAWTVITATDPKHTLRRTSTVTTPGVAYAADFTGLKALQGGNINNDAYIDILDFGGYIGQFSMNFPDADTFCNTGGLNADFSGNASVGTEDFNFISFGFLNFRDADPCGALAGESPVTDVSVDNLVAAGLRSYAMADFNLDGRLNAADVAWVAQNGLPRCSADFNDDQAVNVQDIFAYLNAWFMDHPKADMNANNRTDVQDIFTFLNTWFTGC